LEKMTSFPPTLKEVKETDATGKVAEIYHDLRHALGVPMVNLIFRHMATIPGCLEWTWSQLGPLYISGKIGRESRKLTDVLPQDFKAVISTTDLSVAGLDCDTISVITATLDAYNHANPMNVIGMKLLRRFVSDASQDISTCRLIEKSPPRPEPRELTYLPPMASLDSLDKAIIALLRKMAVQVNDRDGLIIPSLLLHFTQWPGFLKLFSALVEELRLDGRLENESAKIEGKSTKIANQLYRECPDSDRGPPSRKTLLILEDLTSTFPSNICRMIVAATYVRRALPSNDS